MQIKVAGAYTASRIITNNPTHFRYSRFSEWLYLFIVIYLVVPLIDIPLLGLSLSAPMFFFVAVEVVRKLRSISLRPFRVYITLASLIWIGVALSALLNGLRSGGIAFDRDSILAIVRYAYWLLFFVVSVIFITRSGLTRKIVNILGAGIFLIALLRLIEVVLYGNVGAWSGTRFFSQNSYGIMFSTFAPFCFSFLLTWKARRRWLAVLMAVALLAAILVNGSRGSWIGVGIGSAAMMGVMVIGRPRSFMRWLIGFGVLAALAWTLLSVWQPLNDAVQSRYSTFGRLDADKSFAIRQLMNQKSWRLFLENPVLGVGPYRFRKESTELELPSILAYADQSYFDKKSAHNSYLSFLAETGLAGSVPYGLLIVVLAVRGFVSSVHLAKREIYFGAAVLASFVGMSLHMWALSSLTNTVTWFIYALVAVIIVVSQRIIDASKNV